MASSSAIDLPGPSPAKRANPFARPTIPHSPSSFKRTSLLPTLPSPVRPSTNGLSTPSDKLISAHGVGSVLAGQSRSGWRLLWRGGVEIGKEGWRLEGITFFAQLTFPVHTPSGTTTSNPFDAPIQSTHSVNVASPFQTLPLPEGDTDLCLSLESMRGRRYLQIRGVVDLPEEETLEGGDEAGVQMSIASGCPLAVAYFTSMLCRHPKLSSQGRTLSAISIGLGDDLDSSGTTVLVYGQQSTESGGQTLKLCVGRKTPKAPPLNERKVRPGEPLPRAPLFFPSKAPIKPPPPFSRNRTARSLSRAPSVSSIYAPPPPVSSTSRPPASAAVGSGRTPGRRGEKRPRVEGQEKADEKRRRAGKIVPISKLPSGPSATTEPLIAVKQETLDAPTEAEEDIFGKRGSSIGPGLKTEAGTNGGVNDPKSKRPRVPQQVLDNKAIIRKQTLVLMEEKGYSRSHEVFKDVFGMTTKGTYFALRNKLEEALLTKYEVQNIIQIHLDMYLPDNNIASTALSQVKEEDEEEREEENLFGHGAALEQEQEQVRFGEVDQSSEILTSDAPLSDGVASEEPFSDGPLSEPL